jgi:hypothetical protein
LGKHQIAAFHDPKWNSANVSVRNPDGTYQGQRITAEIVFTAAKLPWRYNRRAGVPARHSFLSLALKWRAGTPALLLERLKDRLKACRWSFYILQGEKVTKDTLTGRLAA